MKIYGFAGRNCRRCCRNPVDLGRIRQHAKIMNFASRITRIPRPFDPDRGAEAVELFPDFAPEVSEVVAGAAGCSPFLLSLMQREQSWLAEALPGAPEAAIAQVMNDVRALPVEQLNDGLRQGKRRLALITGLADVAGVFGLFEVTGALTDFADLSVDRALKAEIAREITRGKLPGLTQDDVAAGGGMVALAMGKMGAGELNYSSDVDLICLFDETRFEPDDYHEARSAFIRATRNMSKRLNDRTAEGYVFRMDLRLRPDPSVTPVCLSMEAAERYYESVGRTWERAAHIKARPCAGDLDAGWRYLKELTPFVWRKHLDFAAIEDAHDMRLRIRDHKGFHGAITLEGHNMKLGRGGIREIEFFTQTRQIIAGGRDVDLRSRETLPALRALTDKGWVGEEIRSKLSDHYIFHRTVEHRMQMVNDAQTHDLPKTEEGFQRLTAFMGRDDMDLLRQEIFDRLTDVHHLTESFFAPDEAPDEPEHSEAAAATIARWYSYGALRSDRAKTVFKRLKPELIKRLNKSANPDEALNQFDGFLAGLPAGVQLFSMFEANPHLIDLIVDIASTAPELSRYLGRNSQVLDAVIAGRFFEGWPGVATLRADLSEQLGALEDYEKKLDTARRWNREWHFRIGVHHLRGLIDATTAGQEYADLAEAVLQALTPHIVDEFARKHGPMPGRGAAVLGMGSLGAGRLHSHSDLDLIIIYDPMGTEYSEGPRPLATRPYFARLTQAFVTGLTVQMSEGRLYEVDMRLRPSGRQGPVATGWASFQNYQQDEAWVWEHLALTRARVLIGNPALAQDIEDFRCALLRQKGAPERVLPQVREMRARLAAAKAMEGPFDAKNGAGRMQDLELTAQAVALLAGEPAMALPDQLQAGVAKGVLTQSDADDLCAAYDVMWRLRVASKLLTDGGVDADKIGEGGREFLLRETGFDDMRALQQSLETLSGRAAEVIDAILQD